MRASPSGASAGGSDASAFHVALEGVVKRYPHATANDGASLRVRAGEIHALVGENGAGKSTLMHVLYGLVAPDGGSVRVGEVEGPFRGPREAIAAGVGMVHQHFMLVGPMSVTENVFLGEEPTRRALLDWGEARARVAETARRHGFAIDPDAPVETLGVGVQQRVEILKVLVRGARVLILDEPTAVLTPAEAEGLFDVLRALRDDGCSVILITHRLEEVVRVADRVTVMRRGRTVAAHDVAGTSVESLAAEMVGRPLDEATPRRPGTLHARGALRVEKLRVAADRHRRALDDVSLHVAGGEILGVAGVEGNGQTELAEVVAGIRRPLAGRILVGDRDVTDASRAERLTAGVAFVPEDRLDRGIVRDFTLAENLILGRHRRAPFVARGTLERGEIARVAGERLRAFDVRPPEPGLRAATLSGGNQQKVIMARELMGSPRVLVAAQPTRGVDVGAIQAIHAHIRRVADEGCAVLLFSAELEELLALSDRLVVLYRGRVAGETTRAQADVATLGRWMLRGPDANGAGEGGGA